MARYFCTHQGLRVGGMLSRYFCTHQGLRVGGMLARYFCTKKSVYTNYHHFKIFKCLDYFKSLAIFFNRSIRRRGGDALKYQAKFILGGICPCDPQMLSNVHCGNMLHVASESESEPSAQLGYSACGAVGPGSRSC